MDVVQPKVPGEKEVRSSRSYSTRYLSTVFPSRPRDNTLRRTGQLMIPLFVGVHLVLLLIGRLNAGRLPVQPL